MKQMKSKAGTVNSGEAASVARSDPVSPGGAKRCARELIGLFF